MYQTENSHGLFRVPDARILVVDDDEVICAASERILGESFKVICCNKGSEALRIAERVHPELILLDINLGEMSGFDVLAQLKRTKGLQQIPVMFITADEDREKEVQGLKNGALDFIRKPFVPEVLIQRSKRVITLYRYQKDLKGEVRRQAGRAERLTKEMMVALSQTVDAKDKYTNGHSERVAQYSAEIGRRLGKSPEEQRMLYEIGLMHDVGKIGVPGEIINKAGKLTDEEFDRIKQHTVIGYEILKGIKDLPELPKGARSHHEKYDGSGYPDGLAGDAIPEVARIICVADCYDAMTSTRTYSEPKPQAVVRAEIERCRGRHFDPKFADIMLEMIDDDKDYQMNERNSSGSVWLLKEQMWDDTGDDDGNIPENTDNGIDSYWKNSGNSPDYADMNGSGNLSSGGNKENEIPDWIEKIEELDTRSGIANCGSVASYLSVLSVFHQTAAHKADEIEKLFTDGDIGNYTIKVHALKSSARIIGAAGLSEMARRLEAAGKEHNMEEIGSKTGELLKKYRELDSRLKPMDPEQEETKELTAAMRREAFRTIAEIAGSMDFGMMEDLLRELKGYKLTNEDAEAVRMMEDRLMQLDWDGIIEAARNAQ